jgi:CheY-like chemotaxis protein/PAS domain-containing protein
MRYQPTQPNSEERSNRKGTLPETGFRGESVFACSVLLAMPFSIVEMPPMPLATDSVFTVILAVFAAILGLSAALHFRHMHHREEELRGRADNAEAELRALLMMTDEAVLVLSQEGKVRAVNPAAEEIFDLPAGEFVGETLNKVMAQPLSLGDLTKHGPVNFETTAKRGESGFAQVEMLLSPVELSGGNGYLALIHESRTALSAERPKKPARTPDYEGAIGKFTHDLNNQLTATLGNLSLILMGRPGDPKAHERVLSAKKTALQAQLLSQKLQALVQPSENESATPALPETKPMILAMPNLNPTPTRPSSVSGSRVLILDDEEPICMLVATALGASGFEVTPATNVGAALNACDEAVKAGDPFALVISDLSLPGDMNGIEALHRLRAIDPYIKAIVSSGYDSDPVMRDCRKYGFDAVIAKPYEISRLVRTVRDVLSSDAAAIRKSA